MCSTEVQFRVARSMTVHMNWKELQYCGFKALKAHRSGQLKAKQTGLLCVYSEDKVIY